MLPLFKLATKDGPKLLQGAPRVRTVKNFTFSAIALVIDDGEEMAGSDPGFFCLVGQTGTWVGNRAGNQKSQRRLNREFCGRNCFQYTFYVAGKHGSPNGVRTRVSGVRGQYPRPLDDGTVGWLGDQDSNLDRQIQSLQSYR
jgi:hypothetical protein